MTIGDRVRILRTKLGLTQLELAQKMGYKSKSSVAHIENGRDIPRSMVATLADILGTTPSYLMGWEEWDKEAQTFSDELEKDNGMVDGYLRSRFSKEEERAAAHELIINLPRLELDGLTLLNKNLEVIAGGDTREFAEEKYRTLDGYGKKAVETILDIEYERCRAGGARVYKIPFAQLKVSAGTGEFLSDEMTSIIEIPDTPLAHDADYVVQVAGDSMEPEFFDKDLLLVEKCEQVEQGEIGIFVLNGEGFVKQFGGDRLISLNEKYPDILLHEYDRIDCFGRVLGRV